MEKYVLKPKVHLVQNLIVLNCGSDTFMPQYSFEGFCMNFDSDKLVLLTHYLFRLVFTNKHVWGTSPSVNSAINYVLRYLRYMLTNLNSDDIQDYALANLFIKL